MVHAPSGPQSWQVNILMQVCASEWETHPESWQLWVSLKNLTSMSLAESWTDLDVMVWASLGHQVTVDKPHPQSEDLSSVPGLG